MKIENLFKVAVESGALTVAYLKFGRPRVINWGATQAEVDTALPGDDILPVSGLDATRAITVDVTPYSVWPWLVQMGTRPRAGLYTYNWVERLLGIDIENKHELLPEFQHLDVGEFFSLGKKGEGLRVKDVQVGRAIVLQFEPEGSTWSFVLNPADEGKTRLLSRNRVQEPGSCFRSGL